MKRTILLLSLGTLFSAPVFSAAWAQDSSIRVIHDDGTVDEVEIPGWGAPAKSAPAPEEKAPAASSDLATMPPAAVSRARAKEEAEKAAADEAERQQQAPEQTPAAVSPVDAAIAKAVDEVDAPKSEQAKPEKSAPKKAAKKTDKKKSSPKPAKKNAPNAEEQERMEAGLSRYPAAPHVPGKDLDARPPLDIPPGTEITPQVAKMIALDYAPPARGIEVLPRVHNDKPVYVVRFRTDEGLKDVLIDRETGQPVWD